MNEAFPMVAPERMVPQSHENERPKALAATLGRIEPMLETAIGTKSPLVARFRMLRRRLDQERLQLAVLGQFKRGKSTFINALLGADVLPTGVIPLTAVATFITWRREPLVVVHFRGEAPNEEFAVHTADEIRNVLFCFVAEEANPENRLGVERVDLFYPADILADGTVIIDTPGVGSTLHHNTEAALRVLPECDAAFFVVSADPPITEVELEYLRRLKSKTQRVFFVLNKADYLRPDEKRSIVEFLQKVLAEKSLIDADGQIFCISARDGLEAKRIGNNEALEDSGIAALEDHLVRALASGKICWLEDAVRGKAADSLAQASAELGFRVRALNMPIEELAAKSEAFQNALRSIEEQRRIIRDLLTGDHRRLREALDSRIGKLRKKIAAKLARAIDASLSGAMPTAWEDTARRALSAAMPAEFEAAREPLVSVFAADAGAALLGCRDRVNTLIDRVRRTAAEIFNVSLGPDTEHEAFELGEDPYWVTEGTSATLIPDPSRLIDRLFPMRLRRSRLRARMIRLADELIVRNAENLRWAILRGLDETFRKATAQFEERLDEAIAATNDVIRDALARRRDKSFAIQPELDRLAEAATSLASLRKELQGDGCGGAIEPQHGQDQP
jgi:GTP-binding protein EngB required for normal cell division